MSVGNKIKYEDLIKHHEITLAKCGWLALIWLAYPGQYLSEYELRSNGELIFKSDQLIDAVKKYNELVV